MKNYFWKEEVEIFGGRGRISWNEPGTDTEHSAMVGKE